MCLAPKDVKVVKMKINVQNVKKDSNFMRINALDALLIVLDVIKILKIVRLVF